MPEEAPVTIAVSVFIVIFSSPLEIRLQGLPSFRPIAKLVFDDDRHQ
jgi:hypothetical protein